MTHQPIILFSAAAVALTALRQLVWLYRVRFTRRWKAILDAYAEREISRNRYRVAAPSTVQADRRNSISLKSLKDSLVAELTDLAYPVVLRQGVKGLSVDVELSIWKAIDGALQEMLQRLRFGTAQTAPASGVVLARLTRVVYQAALRHGFRGTFADVEFGLWDAFHSGNFPSRAKDLLRTLVQKD
jgi:hypothetical protein